jgi:hypothetical protein
MLYASGWLGETYTDEPMGGSRKGGMKVLSWEPRIFLFENFLTDGEWQLTVRLRRFQRA